MFFLFGKKGIRGWWRKCGERGDMDILSGSGTQPPGDQLVKIYFHSPHISYRLTLRPIFMYSPNYKVYQPSLPATFQGDYKLK